VDKSTELLGKEFPVKLVIENWRNDKW
jgi:hypothetical protein